MIIWSALFYQTIKTQMHIVYYCNLISTYCDLNKSILFCWWQYASPNNWNNRARAVAQTHATRHNYINWSFLFIWKVLPVVLSSSALLLISLFFFLLLHHHLLYIYPVFVHSKPHAHTTNLNCCVARVVRVKGKLKSSLHILRLITF